MLRRTFLPALAGPLLVGADPPRRIDTHVHFYDPTRPEGVPWPSAKDPLLYRPYLPGDWAQTAAPLGITGAIVVEASPWVADNQWILDLAEQTPLVVGVIGHLEPGSPEFKPNLARFSRNRLFRGIRLDSKALATAITDTKAVSGLEMLSDANLVLDVVGDGSMVAALVSLLKRIPKLRVVVDHLPFEGPLERLEPFIQLYAKVSAAAPQREGLDRLWRVFGEDRLLFGSNWPVCLRTATYEMVYRTVDTYFIERGSLAREKFFCLNSVSAYQWSH